MPDRTLTVTNPDGTKETRSFPATSMAARMEPGRAQWLADHALLLPDGSIQPGVYTAEHLAPLITRPEEDWKIEKLLAVGQSKAWVVSLIDKTRVLAMALRPNTGVAESAIVEGWSRWHRIVQDWPYGQALQPLPNATLTEAESPSPRLSFAQEARVREIVRDELNKQSKEKWV